MSLNIVFSVEIFYPQINGIITTTVNLIKNLQKLGHKVSIVTPRVSKDQPDEYEGITVHYVPSSDSLIYPGLRVVNVRHKIFKQILEKQQVDIIHSTAPWFLTRGLYNAGKKKHIPIILTFHTNLHDAGYIQYIVPFINKHTIRILQKSVWQGCKPFMNPCKMLTAPSPVTCEDMKKVFPLKRIEWVPNGVDLEMFELPQDANTQTLLPPSIYENNTPYALFIGRHAKEKSIDVLLEAVRHTLKTIPDFQLVLVGDGPKRKTYIKHAQKLGIDSHTHFMGKISHETLIKSGLLHHAQFFTTASTTETHSMTVTEALCCGTPVVVANHPSMTYLAEGAGLVFEPNNPIAMSQALIDMWQETDIHREKKKEATYKKTLFDGVKVAKTYESLYFEMIRK